MEIKEVKKALVNGMRCRRTSWKEDVKFVFMQVPAEISKEIVPKMQSLPQSVKDYFMGTFEDEQIDAIYYNNQIAQVNSSNLITSYSPSTSDLLANDWEVL